MTDYQDFEIEIDCDTADGVPPQYFVHVIRSPAGEGKRSPVKFPFSGPEKLAALRADLESAVKEIDGNSRSKLTSRAEQALQDFGKEIFRNIFVDVKPVSDVYAQSKSKDLRIKLRIGSLDLAALPWEYLYEEDEIISYVSLRRPLVRYVEVTRAAEPMAVRGPLRILGMVSAPKPQGWQLNVVEERARIETAVDKLQREGRIVFEWVLGGTGKDLMNKLLEKEWHIFHFIGHGGVESQPEDGAGAARGGYIVMVDEDGNPVKQFASDLAMMLLGASKSLRLIVLNCCEGAKINLLEKFGNPAVGLMQSGWLPAVVAMQYPITDEAAIGMSEGFYRALANNFPVDKAIMTARQFMRVDEHSKVEFGIPVLYMRSADGKIFEIDNPTIEVPSVHTTDHTSEGLQKRREEFMLAATPGLKSADELEQLARRGQELIIILKDDNELAKRLAQVYLDLGGLQQKQKQIPQAAASFGYAITLDPNNPEYYVKRANFNALVGRSEVAVTDINAAIRLRPDAEYYWIKGIICGMASGPENKQGYLQQAVEAFGVAVSKKASEPKYLVSRANAFAQMGSVTEALEDIDRAMELAPDNSDLIAQRGRIQALKA